MNDDAIWACKIGPADRGELPDGADGPMRRGAAATFFALTGQEADFIFSGWGATLDEAERAVLENREPRWPSRSMLEAAWGIIANAWGGNWALASDEWREAAARWRDEYHDVLDGAVGEEQ